MQRLKNSIFLQEAYSGNSINQVNDYDLFLYESMVEHKFNPDYKPSAFILACMLDALILDELGDVRLDMSEVKKVSPTLALYYEHGLPSQESFDNRLYNNIYYQISSPLYHSNFSDPYIPNNYNTRSVIENNAKQHAINETGITRKYFNNCVEYVRGQDVVINGRDYLEEIRKNPVRQRTSVIKDTIKGGELKGGNKKPRMDLNLHFKDTFQYLYNVSEFEAKVYANALQHSMGKKEPYSYKTWIWSHKVKTRHKFMHGQTVPINEPFLVTNERTGEMSNLMYPRDYARDVTGANTINCGCEVNYHNNKEGELS